MSRLGVRSGLAAIAVVGVVANLLAGCASALPPSSNPAVSTASPEPPAPIRIGVILPRSGDAGALAAEELYGIQIAVDVLNADGGVDGAPVSLEVHQIDSATQAPPVLDALKVEGVNLVMGAYSSELSIPLSAMVSGRGMVYWETGAVADMLTGRGLPNVFRVGASSTTLGTDSGAFVLGSLAPLLGRTVPDLRVALVNARDDYATEVAQAADRVLSTGGADIVARLSYPPAAPVFGGVLARLAAAKPDVIVLASHIPDGIAFRQQMIAAGLHVGALVGTTMAECVPDFATPLGPDAVGIFGSDRPSGAFNASALAPDARALYERFASRFAAMQPAPSATPAQSIRCCRLERRARRCGLGRRRGRRIRARGRRVRVLGGVGPHPRCASCRGGSRSADRRNHRRRGSSRRSAGGFAAERERPRVLE